MSDVFDKATRSAAMSKVCSKSNKSTELRLIEVFTERGIKSWWRGYPVKGHPDFVFPKRRIAVFVDGCFWHGHDCRNARPKRNEDIWGKSWKGTRLEIKRSGRNLKIRLDGIVNLGVRTENEEPPRIAHKTRRLVYGLELRPL